MQHDYTKRAPILLIRLMAKKKKYVDTIKT